MSENFGRNEGLQVLARIIAKAYLADSRCDVGTAKTCEEGKKDERISRTGRNSPNGKCGK